MIWSRTTEIRVNRRQEFFASGQNGDATDSYRWENFVQQKWISETGEEEWRDVEIVTT